MVELSRWRGGAAEPLARERAHIRNLGLFSQHNAIGDTHARILDLPAEFARDFVGLRACYNIDRHQRENQRQRDESQIEAWLTAEGSRTRLVVEERGLPVDTLHFYGAGWQAHLEDLGRSLSSEGMVHADGWSAQTAAAGWQQRWTELTPGYQDRSLG